MRLLLEAGAMKDARDATARQGWTPLLLASLHGHFDSVSFLIEVGCDLSVETEDLHANALHVAAAKGHHEIVQLLINSSRPAFDINSSRRDIGATALFLAAEGNKDDVVAVLIQNMADLNKAAFGGGTPLYIASQKGHLEVVRLLLGARADMHQALPNGSTPLFIARDQNHVDVVRLLRRQNDHAGDTERALGLHT